ncbi:MAG: hypothetical protein H6576_08020 [Lewinellaceae bacterium]|nr:hypothetical protein [Saprospiraceae bacterium]MCB9343627.1 hypothetical protein [Lewinellaceae bacterium]
MKQFTVILGTCLFLACQRETVTFVLSPQEEKLIGKWQEIANKLPIRDSSGMVIDSLDISAQYEFKADYTFTSQNEFFTNAESGTWIFQYPDSNSNLFIYPDYGTLPNDTFRLLWELTYEAPYMKVGQLRNLVLPDKIIGIYEHRKFIRVE